MYVWLERVGVQRALCPLKLGLEHYQWIRCEYIVIQVLVAGGSLPLLHHEVSRPFERDGNAGEITHIIDRLILARVLGEKLPIVIINNRTTRGKSTPNDRY